MKLLLFMVFMYAVIMIKRKQFNGFLLKYIFKFYLRNNHNRNYGRRLNRRKKRKIYCIQHSSF